MVNLDVIMNPVHIMFDIAEDLFGSYTGIVVIGSVIAVLAAVTVLFMIKNKKK